MAKRRERRACPRCKEETVTIRVHWLLPDDGARLLFMVEVECSACAYSRRLQAFNPA